MTPSPEARRGEHEASFGGARDGIAVLSPSWRIRYMNASMLDILRLIGREDRVATLWDALPGWEHSDAAGTLRHAMETGAAVCFRVDGERGRGRVWEVEAEPLQSGELRVRVRNVTAQAQLEAAERRFREAGASLEEREARLAAIISGAPVGMVLLEAATFTAREANAFYHQFLEGPWRVPGAIIGHRVDEFIPDFEALGIGEIFRGVRDSGEPFEISEFEFAGFERGPTFFRWTLQPLAPAPDEKPRYLLLLVVEITEQVLGRRAAEAERKALYDVLDTLPVGVIVAQAPTGRITYINPAGVALGGRPADELAAGELVEYPARWQTFRLTGEPFPAGELPLTRALRGEPARDVEIVLRPADGGERTVSVSSVPLRDAAGRVDRALAVFYDLTDRLALERALLERTREAEDAASETALRAEESRALREIGRVLVSELEPGRVLDLAAHSAMELLGSRAAVLAVPHGAETVRLSPALGALADLDGRVFATRGMVLGEVLSGGGTRVFNDLEQLPETSPMRAVARERGLRNLAVAPLRAFGAPVGVLAVVDRGTPFTGEDVRLLEGLADTAALAIHNARLHDEERRRGEENRALLAAAEALTSTLDPGEVMHRIAGAARELSGADGAALTMYTGENRERTQVMAAVGMMAPLAGVSVPAGVSVTWAVAAAGEPLATTVSALPEEMPSRAMLASVGAEHAVLVPMRIGGEEVVGILAVVNGPERGPLGSEALRVVSLLADQAALAVRNARLYAGAQSASRAKSEFLAMMSHELRTPLNALEGYAGLMEEGIYGPLTELQRDALRRMKVSRRHLMELIDSVLDLARVEAGTRRAQPEVFDLGELVESVGEAMRGAADARKLALEIEAEGAGRIVADRGLLRQVLTNLLGNAIKFTERGAVTVRARREGDRATIEVTDTGPGISAENQARVFEPFFQVDPSTTRREGGTGLGLALSRDFVRLLGGEIAVRSEPGQGSTFTVTLPVEAKAEASS
ncbi:ATP-binding protein [Longimicrobium sp.]|uniref:ATP-binding protein n=1 Tax=Longimicrobium sp. TaxID=2029185 RepID=UPI002BD7B099|nr:ATP-binding protein [Longimicrobium sp.]HSU14074.1 ATP-binding protein [Longimicrobium sp.]